MNKAYTIELHQDPGEGWFARVKELRGCMSQGDTIEEVLAEIEEAQALWLETALEDGGSIPEPECPLDKVRIVRGPVGFVGRVGTVTQIVPSFINPVRVDFGHGIYAYFSKDEIEEAEA